MGEKTVEVQESDLNKVYDALHLTGEFFKHRDVMNAQVHKAAETRYSPITSTVLAELDRVKALIEACR